MKGSKVLDSESVFQDSLNLLEWPRLCEHLATFASTTQGILACKNLPIPQDVGTTRLRLAELLEIGSLDHLIDGGLSFRGIHDLGEVLLRCQKRGCASGEELLKVAETLGAARKLRRQIDDIELRPVTTALLKDLATLPDLETRLKFGLEEGGRVADRASSKLAGLRRQCQSLLLERRDLLQALVRRHGQFLQDTVVVERHGRPVLSLKAGAIGQLQGMVHDSSASGNTIFLEPQSIIPLGNKIVEIESYIKEEEFRLLAAWSADVSSNFASIDHLSHVILHLDVALARARYSYWLGGVPPIFSEEVNSSFLFTQLRHPLLVWQQRKEQGEEVIPVTLEVNSHVKVVAITGPNTGGKTVTLKSVGLAVLMARAGLFIPCKGRPTLPWCEQVLADIGDEQSLQQSLSTFSGHLTRICRILDAVTRSHAPVLVLLDEIGAGTDPVEGTALAIALLKTFADRARLTIATTHFGELKALKYSDPRFENASVSFDSITLTPTYCLQWGIPGRSNAIAIARRLGLDPLVTDRAQKLIVPNGEKDVNKVIFGMEEQRKRQQAAAEDAAALLARTEILYEEILSRWQKQSQQSLKTQTLRRKELETSIQEGQKEVRNLIKRLRADGADGETARQVGQHLRRMQKQNVPKRPKDGVKGWTPRVGERIRLIALGKAGEVKSISEDGLQLSVVCGVFRTTVDLNDVESLDGESPITPQPVIQVDLSSRIGRGANLKTTSNTVDVRGLRVHEAEVAVEEYLRRANGPLWVIHGIGTGKLKQGLREWLKSVPYVERVVDADQRDGGAGCSVVWLQEVRH